MEHREYQAPLGFVIESVRIRCVHCGDVMPAVEASTHKLGHAIEKSREKGSGKRQCNCTPEKGINPHCPKHKHLLIRRRS